MKTEVLGVEFDNITMDEAVSKALSIMAGKGGYVVTPNPEIVMGCLENGALRSAVAGSSLTLPDGIGIVYGAKLLKTPLKSRLPGIDFACALMGKMAEKGMSVFLFGSKPGVAKAAAEKLKSDFPGLDICGTADGYFSDDAVPLTKINAAKPDLLLVCLGSPKQELWMQAHPGAAKLMIGLGGSLDVFAGNVKRAPESWQKLGLEWLYRLTKEPTRIKRMIKLPYFLVLVIKSKFRKK